MEKDLIYELTPEELAISAQLARIRRDLVRLRIDERTNEDALLAILRGHGVQAAHGIDPTLDGPVRLERRVDQYQEAIVLNEKELS